MSISKLRIALDAGGVIFSHSHSEDNKEDTSQVTNWMNGAIDTIRALSKEGHTLFVNSFAGKATGQATTKEILDKLGDVFTPERIVIVKNRNLKYKPCIDLKIDVMVDDREDVLDSISQECLKRNLPCPRLILFNSTPRVSFDNIVDIRLFDQESADYVDLGASSANKGYEKVFSWLDLYNALMF